MEHSTKIYYVFRTSHQKILLKNEEQKQRNHQQQQKKEKISSKLFSPLIYIFQIEISSTFYSRHKNNRFE